MKRIAIILSLFICSQAYSQMRDPSKVRIFASFTDTTHRSLDSVYHFYKQFKGAIIERSRQEVVVIYKDWIINATPWQNVIQLRWRRVSELCSE